MRYYAGLDQGGSKTAALVGDAEGHILGVGKSRGAVHSTDGLEAALSAIEEALRAALSQAGLEVTDLFALHGGLSGIDWDYEKTLMQAAVKKRFPVPEVCVVNDCLIALRAGTDKENCAVLCAGSGVNCAVRSGQREIVYGYYIPDNLQGGWGIGADALQRVFDAEAGIGPKTALTELLCGFFGAQSVDELLQRRVNGQISARDCMQLPRIIEQAALDGDAVSNAVYRDFAAGIVPYALAGMKKFGILEEEVDVVLSGSIFKCRAPILHETIREKLGASAKRARLINALYEPVVGAYLMGLDRQYAGEIPEEVYEVLDRERQRFPLTRITGERKEKEGRNDD